jgi:branched-chain amino acid transport system permease protein
MSSAGVSAVRGRWRAVSAYDLRGRLLALPAWVRFLLLVGLIAFIYGLPYMTIPVLDTPGSNFATVLFFPVGMYVLCAVGLDLAVGRAGIVNFGFAGFFALGAYTMAWLATKHGVSFYATVPIAAVVGALAALIMGVATLRLRGDYLAIVTLAFGLIVVAIINNTQALGGINGISGVPHPGPLLGLTFGTFDAGPYDVLLFTMIILVVLAITRLFNSRVGRAWAAIRQDEDVAELMGVPTFRFKVAALVLGGAIGGLAGSAYAAQAIYVSPDQFDVSLSVLFVSAVVLGGAGNLLGVVIGAIVIAYLPERFRGFEDLRILVFSAVLTLMMIARPQGLIPRRRAGVRRPQRKEPRDPLPLAGHTPVPSVERTGPAVLDAPHPSQERAHE